VSLEFVTLRVWVGKITQSIGRNLKYPEMVTTEPMSKATKKRKRVIKRLM